MRYILTLFLIALVSSSEVINKSDEIKKFAEYEDNELQILFRIFPIIEKICIAGIALCAKARAFINNTKILKYIKGAEGVDSKIMKGRSGIITRQNLIQKSKIFYSGKQLFDKGREIYNEYSGIINSPRIDRKNINIIDKVKQGEIYQNYQKIRNTYNKAKDAYDKLKNYYEKGLDIYNKYFKHDKTPKEQHKEYQRIEQGRTLEYQAQKQRLNIQEKKSKAKIMQQKLQQEQKNQAFKSFRLYAQ